jgi:RNA polymerase sigma factor (sigma-70 family)
MSTSTLTRSRPSPADVGEVQLTDQTNCRAWIARGPKRPRMFQSVDCTEVVIQRNLDRLAEATDEPAASAIVRDLLAGAVSRLHWLCACMLFRSYPRLTRPPINLRTDELLSSVVERMIKAMRSVRPRNIRQFFAVCNQHMRWELNDLARRLDKQPHACRVNESFAAAELPSTCSQLSPNAVRILEAINGLPDAEREMFDLVRLQGMTFQEAALTAGVCVKTVQRRLNRALILLSEQLSDLS